MFRTAIGPIAKCAALLAICAAGVAPAARQGSSLLMEKHLVAVDSGRRLNLVCVGRGDPVLVFEQGLGSHILAWEKVVDAASRLTRACFYDRAGYGYSDPAARPATSQAVAEDLHDLLRRARLTRPVILVGHSIGGLFATYYADRNPQDVAGLVLVEPSFAGQDSGSDAAQLARDETQFRDAMKGLRACAGLAQLGLLASEDHPKCFAYAPGRSAAEKAFLRYQMIRPARYEAMISESESFHAPDGSGGVDSVQAGAAATRWGDKPVIVLTAALAPAGADASPADRAAAETAWKSWRAGHQALATRSSRGEARIVTGSGHMLQSDRPDAVIDAIRQVVAEVRKRR